MNEVDKHIRNFLNSLNCSFAENAENADDLLIEELTDRNVFEVVVRFLWKIDPSTKTSLTTFELPDTVSERFGIVSNVTQILKMKNINIGFKTILYGNSTEIRKLCISLIEKLPIQGVSGVKNNDSCSKILTAAAKSLQRPRYLPQSYSRRNFPWMSYAVSDALSISAALSGRQKHIEEKAPREIIAECFAPLQATYLNQNPYVDKVYEHLTEENVIDAKKCEHERLKTKQDILYELSNDIATKKRRNFKNHREYLNEDMKGYKITGKKNQRLYELLRDSENGRSSIKLFLDERMRHRADREIYWCQKRFAVREKLETLRIASGSEMEDLVRQINTIESSLEMQKQKQYLMQNSIPNLMRIVTTVRDDKVLREELCIRLFDITENYEKLNTGLKSILNDIETSRKELNRLSDSSYRSFNLIEESLYQITGTHKGEQMYRLFSRINTGCLSAIQKLEKNGSLSRGNEKLRNTILQLRMDSKFENLPNATEEMKLENEQLKTQL